MSSWRLKDGCVFVEAHDHDDLTKKKPDKYNFPHVFNKTNGDYLPFDDTGGFIARFIVQGVDPADIPKILKSEFGPPNPQDEYTKAVDEVLDELAPLFIEARQPSRRYVKHVKKNKLTGHDGTFELCFHVNPIGIVVLKLPIS